MLLCRCVYNMSVHRVTVQGFRLFEKPVEVEFCKDLNIFYGLNGSGKTAFLEVIYYLSRGRSFKQSNSNKLIHFSANEFLILSELVHSRKIGFHKKKHQPQIIKYNTEYLTSCIELSQLITLQILHPDSHFLINAGPSYRRKYIDWLVFHVKHSLSEQWKRYQIILKNRNHLLKTQADPHLIQAWDNELIQLSELFAQERSQHIQIINDKLKYYHKNFLQEQYHIGYFPGWKTDDYQHVLQENLDNDILRGRTHYGIHRADLWIKFVIDKHEYLAKDFLSNGEKKFISLFLYLLQIELYCQYKENEDDYNRPVILIDDIASELDSRHLELIFHYLRSLDAQIFITVLENKENLKWMDQLIKSKPYKLFHVKQGKIKEQAQ